MLLRFAARLLPRPPALPAMAFARSLAGRRAHTSRPVAAAAAPPHPTKPPPRLADRARPPATPAPALSPAEKKKAKGKAARAKIAAGKPTRDPTSITQLVAVSAAEADAAGLAALAGDASTSTFAGLGLDERVLVRLKGGGRVGEGAWWLCTHTSTVGEEAEGVSDCAGRRAPAAGTHARNKKDRPTAAPPPPRALTA